jgi:hypothetical protein
MRFPHAYGPVPLAAVTSVLPYRPDRDGFSPPEVPEQDPAGRLGVLEPSLLRRSATAEEPVTGGVAVLAEPGAGLVHAQPAARGPRGDGRAGGRRGRPGARRRRAAAPQGPADRPESDATAHGLSLRGWTVDKLIGMASPVDARPDEPHAPHAEQVERLRLAVTWARTGGGATSRGSPSRRSPSCATGTCSRSR